MQLSAKWERIEREYNIAEAIRVERRAYEGCQGKPPGDLAPHAAYRQEPSGG